MLNRSKKRARVDAGQIVSPRIYRTLNKTDIVLQSPPSAPLKNLALETITLDRQVLRIFIYH